MKRSSSQFVDHGVSDCHQLFAESFLSSVKTFAGLEFFGALGRAVAYQSVFCHNDLLSGNCLLQEEQSTAVPSRNIGDITIIDYEYGAYNFRAFDIANHFNEWTGFDLDIVNKFPTREVRMEFIRTYLHEVFNTKQVDLFGNLSPKGVSTTFAATHRLDLSSLSREEVNVLVESFDEVAQIFTLGSHYIWGKTLFKYMSTCMQTQAFYFIVLLWNFIAHSTLISPYMHIRNLECGSSSH